MGARRPARIVVVDDDPGILRAVQRVLGSEHEVHCTEHPADAPQLVADLRPDLAICDVQMPELDGFALLERLRQTAPDLDVILMTGSLTDQDAHLIRSLRERVFYFILKPFDRDVLKALVDRCLESRRLRQAERRHLDRLERELGAARAFQKALLPPEEQTLRGVSVHARWRSCAELGGDLFDAAETSDGRVALVVADVCGHGVPAALLTGTVKTVFRAAVTAGAPPAAMATNLAHALFSFEADRFVTAFFATYEPASRRLEYVNAGHPSGCVLGDSGAVTQLAANAPLLSNAFPLDSWDGVTTTLAPGSRLFLYTDGLTDPGPNGVRYPAARVLELLRRRDPPAALLDGLLRDLASAHGGAAPLDDVTLMLVC